MTTPTLKIKVTPTPKIRGKMDVRFPADVSASSPIILDRTGGNFALSFDLNSISGGFATAAQGEKADTALQSIVAGTNVSVDSTDPQNPIVSAIGSGSGDVTGPASAADGTPAVFDGTDGKVLKNVSYATFKSSLSLAKGDVSLGNVDNTSDATKNSAVATLTNKTITGAAQVTITPAAASITKGLDITQSGPTSGSQGTGFNFNEILVNGDAANVSGNVNAFQAGIGFGGANAQGQRVAVRGLGVLNSATSASNPAGNAYVGVSGEFQFGDDDGGSDLTTGAKGTGIGIYGSAIAVNGAVNLSRVTPAEFNSSMRTGSSARYHFGMQVTQWGDHAVAGAGLDAAAYFGNQSGAIGWKDYGIVFDNTISGVGTMFQSTATAIGIKGAMTLTSGVDFSAATFTGSAFKSSNFSVNPSGYVHTRQILDANGNEEVIFAPTASAVNELTITNAATANAPSIAATGGDTNIGLSLLSKGTGIISLMPQTGQVVIGSLISYAVNSEAGSAFTPAFQIQSTGAGATASITRWSANANQGRFAFAKSRGAAIGTRGAVQSGDVLGSFLFDGDDGTNFVSGAVIHARVSGTPGTNDMPTDLSFGTTPDGAGTPTEWMVLRSYGLLESAGGVRAWVGTAPPAGGTAGVGYMVSSTANLGIFFGSGVPTLSAAQGSLYIRTDGSTTATRLYVNTNGTTGWTNFTSAT